MVKKFRKPVEIIFVYRLFYDVFISIFYNLLLVITPPEVFQFDFTHYWNGLSGYKFDKNFKKFQAFQSTINNIHLPNQRTNQKNFT